jgi:hypothetical protein|tara:strand:+ start:475 stop:675 length:201 start_codon:yes stop_codon:yes gene_type:complete
MATPYKYRNVSLRNEVYSNLNKLSNTLVKGYKVSNAKAVEILIKEKLNGNSEDNNEGVSNEQPTQI